MKNIKDLQYAVYNSLDIQLLNTNEIIEYTTKSNSFGREKFPILFIKSSYIKTSSGQGLYNYYTNQFFDSNHNELLDNVFLYDGIKIIFLKDDYWGNLKDNTNSMLIFVSIIDKLGIEKEMIFNLGYKLENRFKELFNYMSLLILVDTHKACDEMLKKEVELKKMEKDIKTLKNHIQKLEK